MDINVTQVTVTMPLGTGTMINQFQVTDPGLIREFREADDRQKAFRKFEAHQERMKQPARWYDQHR